MALHMLTTSDNPFNPFTEWDAWFAEDRRLGYNTPEYLARIVVTSEELSETDQDQDIEDAIDEIIRENITGKYIKIAQK